MGRFMFDFLLFGIYTHQLLIFLSTSTYKTDRKFIKLIVGYTTIITLITTIWSFYCMWIFFVSGFGEFGPWIEFDREFFSCSLLAHATPFVSTPVSIQEEGPGTDKQK